MAENISAENTGTSHVAKPNFHGKYTFVRNEKFEEFLSANGAGWMIRKMATSTSPSLIIVQEGDKLNIKLQSLAYSRESNFTVGVDFEEAMPNGVVMVISSAWEGSKLVLHYVPKVAGAAKPNTQTRELNDDIMTLTLQVDDVVAKRIFKKVE